ncbi:hypothetical protein ACS6GB_06195 [Enterobacter hormaechei subsp. xiangfangensis]|nr:hypothetical protein [Enterobacter hormaechei]EKW7976191.1 hypothetical protein [Enterobacter hormaechei]ELD3491428.1 hypothetical protein [Enterobacter hormaechei]MDX7383244.1 hypothetical protein [Enterobacter hormaechei]RLZ74787.1 hypothetical protein EA146_10445 [Enterobacter hormaechei]WKA97964.1 hypothetical protein QT958_13570 [Enterobacter hormaechei]
MAELTKEWLQQTIAELEEERDAVPGVVNEDAARALAAMKRALASLEAEAIGFAFADDLDLMRKKKKIGGMLTVRHHGEIAVYTAPPVPVSVSGEVTGAIENLKQTLVDCNRYNYCSGAVKRLENACRAAMLQGADGNSPVIPDGWVMVPVELTGAMTNAMTDAILDDLHNVDVWRSVLAAAPQREVK